MAPLQAERPIEVTTPLGEDVLLFQRMEASEQLSRLFEYELELLSDDAAINLEDLVGQNVTVRLNLPDDSTRYFNGFVSRFSHEGHSGTRAAYKAIVRPWLWFLTRTSDCRVFQDISVPDIVKEICGEHGYSGEIEDALTETYRQWTYCVQYRETDFNFISRLMEQEGIYYYFKHEDGKHTMVLADAHASHELVPGYGVPFFAVTDGDHRETDHMFDWSVEQQFQSCAYALSDYDFERPRSEMKVAAEASREHPKADLEIYDYPGEYTEPGAKAEQFAASDFTEAGRIYAESRINELQCQFERASGRGNARGLYTGGLFELVDCPRDDQNREYLIVAASYELAVGEYESGGNAPAAGEDSYVCNIEAMDSKQVFRPQRNSPKPVVQGPQTAVVTGASGEEIWTDKYGRVEVQFPWDRYGKNDENSSCWIRVASVWAGKAWGGVQIPRIGQEVIVEFLEGDPDRPLITGRVYNGDNMPPYTLPDNKTQSGMKSRSSKGGGGGNFNELRFEDKKGDEEVYLHAEKNHTNITENDRSEDVGNDRVLHVGNNKSESVDNNKGVGVKNNHTESIGGNMSVSVTQNLTETVGVNYAETVGVAMELTVGAAMTHTVGAALAQTVGAVKSVNVAKDVTEDYGNDHRTSVSNDRKADIGKTLTLDVGEDGTCTIAKNCNLTAKKIAVVAEDELSISVGKAILLMKKDGTITLKGKDIEIKGSGGITAKASKDMVLKGKKISQN